MTIPLMTKFLHIYISPHKNATQEDVEKKLNLAIDWYRYANGMYVVYTSTSSVAWKARLIDLVKPDGRMLICKLYVSTRKGWMNKDFWEWLKKNVTAQLKRTGAGSPP